MATGPVSSATVQQTAQTAPTLRSGEQIATTPKALKSLGSKTYYHTANGARFVMPDGLEIIFMGGQFTTADKEIIAELDRVADRPTSMIYTKQEALVQATATLTKQVADDAANTAGTGASAQ